MPQSSRGMLERGERIDASYEGERFAFRPIGIYWLQAATAKLLGRGAWDDDRDLPAAVAARPASWPCSRCGG